MMGTFANLLLAAGMSAAPQPSAPHADLTDDAPSIVYEVVGENTAPDATLPNAGCGNCGCGGGDCSCGS